jgi:hypothetical protein
MRIGEQNTRDESNPEHFSVKAAKSGVDLPGRRSVNCRLERLPVLFRHKRAEN